MYIYIYYIYVYIYISIFLYTPRPVPKMSISTSWLLRARAGGGMPTANSLRANLRWSWVKFPMFRCSETRRESYLDVRGRLGLVGASNLFGYQLWFWVTLWLKAFWFGVKLIMV